MATFVLSMQQTTSEKSKVISSLIPPLLFTAVLWFIKFIENQYHLSFDRWGVYPRSLYGMKGILTSPLLHGDWQHLTSNSIPLVILGSMMIYFYREVWLRAFTGIYLLSGFWLWLSGREAYHLGASGLVYGITAFLIVSGIIRRHTGLMAVSLVVIFLYGGLIWGIFPLILKMSWEAHLSGLMAGILMAVYYRKQGTQRIVYEWENEPDEPETNPALQSERQEPVIRYMYKPNDENQTGDEKN